MIVDKKVHHLLLEDHQNKPSGSNDDKKSKISGNSSMIHPSAKRIEVLKNDIHIIRDESMDQVNFSEQISNEFNMTSKILIPKRKISAIEMYQKIVDSISKRANSKTPITTNNIFNSPKHIKQRRPWLSFSSCDKLSTTNTNLSIKENNVKSIGKSPIFFNKYNDNFMDLKPNSSCNMTQYDSFKFKPFLSHDLRKSQLLKLLLKLNKKSRPEWSNNFRSESQCKSCSPIVNTRNKNTELNKFFCSC